jgi:NAD(P)H-quinone oxidoreductase subunit 5
MTLLLHALAYLTLGAPLLALVVLCVGHLSFPHDAAPTALGADVSLGAWTRERRIQQITAWVFALGVLCGLAMSAVYLVADREHFVLDIGPILSLRGYHFDLELELDAVTLPLLVLTFAVSSLVAAYSARYLHRDPGFFRFYLLLVLFALGMELIVASRSLTLLFAGWELVGLTSALLIAFFHERPAPVRHALRAYGIYRTTDLGLLVAVALLEHQERTADFDAFGGFDARHPTLWLVGALIVFGAMGKGGIFPFTGWLPRAMEGPTPSSAIFYGALSVHASPYLLIRAAPLLLQSSSLRVAVVALGGVTVVHAFFVGRTRPDIKTALGYASVLQVGLIWMETGFGQLELALAHMLLHAVYRTWQLLRSPSELVNRHARPERVGRTRPWRRAWHAFHLDAWHLDDVFRGCVWLPVRRLLGTVDRLDRAVLRAGGADDEPERARVDDRSIGGRLLDAEESR